MQQAKKKGSGTVVAKAKYTGVPLYQEGATYGPRATSGPRRLIFLALTLPF